MKLSYVFPIAVTLLSCLTNSVAAGVPHTAIRRQDDGSSTSSTSSAASSTTTDVSSTHSPKNHKSHDSTKTSSAHAHASATHTKNASKNKTHGDSDDGDELPLQPIITPAVGVAGAFLLITGVAYTLIGIKSPWLYISFSTAYLSSLSITVLIVYVMSPPVSDAVQGAYFVAAFIPGAILGGVSIIFKEVTDKLACVLGGFCLTMWFMTLKEGGLITSSTGKIIFIACMCVGSACLAFTRRTKDHVLIVTISFGGATATVLGIDCFSRAGLKEFWIYIWDLNDSEFPLHTHTYPITRGMRVELAATIIIFLIGLMSQYKIWKIIKARREKKAAAQRAAEDDLDKIEAAVGQRVQGDNTRDMARWEAEFEGKDDSGSNTLSGRDSMVETVPKHSVSVREVRRSLSDTIEMEEMPSTRDQSQTNLVSEKPKHTSKPGRVEVHVIEDDVIQREGDGTRTDKSIDGTAGHSGQSLQPGLIVGSRPSSGARLSSEAQSPSDPSAPNSIRISVPPPPEVVPPPFVVPQEDDNRSDSGSVESTAAASMRGQRNSARLSFPNALKRLSRNSAMSDSTEALVVPHIEDDRASSVAATMDLENENGSLPALSAPSSPMPTKVSFEEGAQALKRDEKSEEPRIRVSVENPEHFPMLRLSLDPPSERGEIDMVSKIDELSTIQGSNNTPRSPMEEGSGVLRAKSANSHRSSGASPGPTPMSNLSEHLPSGLSKVAMTYRTNEWAKHLELADMPEVDEIKEPSRPGMSVNDKVETPAPVVVEQPRRAYSSKQSHQSNNPYRQPSSGGSQPRSSMDATTTKQSPKRSTSQLNLGGNLSSSNVANTSSQRRGSERGMRSSSGPLATLGGEIPEEGKPSRPFPTPLPNNTLIGQRNSMMQMKPVSTSFNASTTSQLPPQIPESGSIQNSTPGAGSATGSAESEELSLAQRKALLELQQQQQGRHSYQAAPAPTRRTSGGYASPYNTFDSHQPQRENSINPVRRENMLANWRESVRHEIPTTGNAGATMTRQPSQQQVAAARRDQMMNERRRSQKHAQKQQAREEQKELTRNSMMRQTDMLSAHAAAMKKMQASANKNVGSSK